MTARSTSAKRSRDSAQSDLDLDGRCSGPLFGPLSIERVPKLVGFMGRRLPGTYRRMHERRAVPPWVDKRELHLWYRAARLFSRFTGRSWSVEHTVPLKHPLVCGLHCPDNFEIVLLEENVRKGNRWWPDMPETQATLEGIE